MARSVTSLVVPLLQDSQSSPAHSSFLTALNSVDSVAQSSSLAVRQVLSELVVQESQYSEI